MSAAPTRPSRTGVVARWALHLALIAAIGAFIVARDDRLALLLFVPLAVAPAIRWRRAPRAVAALFPALSRIALLGVFALAVLGGQLRLLRDDQTLAWGTGLGWSLAILAVAFMLGHRIWPVTTTLVPAIVGLLAVGGLAHGASLFPWFATGGAVALWGFAFVQGGPRRLGLPLAGFITASVAVTAGTLWFLPWAQPWVEGAVARTFGEAATGLAKESRLGEFGTLAASNRIVLRVWTDRPRLLRAYVHTRFDGREWTDSRAHGRPVPPPLVPGPPTARGPWLSDVPGAVFVVPPADRLSEAEGRIVETRVLQSAIEDWPLLAPASPLLVRAPTSLLMRGHAGVLRWAPFEPARLYGTVHDGGSDASGADEGVTGRAVSLGLPGRLDPRIRVLAATLATDAKAPRARVENTVRWLQTHYAYSLNVGDVQTDDPLAEFLFDTREGYCEYFATAAAILLRLQGIPTRYVKGFTVGPQNFIPGRLGVGDHYVVRERDAHAWVEAYIPGSGWVEADPTPPSEFALLDAPSRSGLGPLVDALRVQAARVWARLRHEGLIGFWGALSATAGDIARGLARRPLWTVALVLVLAAALSRRWLGSLGTRLRSRRRARREREAAFPGELDGLLSTVERHWARRGRGRPPAVGLREHLDHLPAGVLTARERAASAEVVDACYRAAFGGRPPSADEVETLRAAVARLR